MSAMAQHVGDVPAASSAMGIALPAQCKPSIRILRPADLAGLGRDLQRLRSDCRRSRFGLVASDAFLSDYAGRVDLANTVVLGCFVEGELRGACEVRSLRSEWCDVAELAFTVEKSGRSRGIGTARMARAIRAARHLGIVYLTCQRGKRGMQCIAAKFAASMSYDDGECFADISMHCQPISALLEPAAGAAAAGRIVVLDLLIGPAVRAAACLPNNGHWLALGMG